ncbi:Zinc finger, AN1-type domain 1 [Nesidiocoris tenuis]|uniref:Zinc finger, AN1-type domain 1 n=1 Tax=Nesidiocoris tenuis TaxID=355587 RepID=A0ABN7AYK9_9HEMI|nr:Zinc finger, AN1-type domain 1 [Nesidiocoris tenuis]
MEFPEAGENCSAPECKTLDFLPVSCSHCGLIFCKTHFSPLAHQCKKAPDNVVSVPKTADDFHCFHKGCTQTSPVDLTCEHCNHHFCPTHRHHGCTDAPRVSKGAQAAALKKEFRKIKEETDKQVQDRLKKAKNRALANKIKVMKIKGSAVGDNRVPVADRLFFAVAPPLSGKESVSAKSIFFSKEWTLGKTIDSAAKRLKADNKNDRPNEPQLNLFSADGNLISPTLNVTLESLLDKGHLVNGDNIILEYVEPSINCAEEDVSLDPKLLPKYSFTV